MSQLSPVTLEYNGRTHVIDKEDGIWGLIEAIEDVIGYFPLIQKMSKGDYPAAKIYRAYASALNYADPRNPVTPNQIRSETNYEDLGQMTGALAQILAMGQPDADLEVGDPRTPESEDDGQKKSEAE